METAKVYLFYSGVGWEARQRRSCNQGELLQATQSEHGSMLSNSSHVIIPALLHDLFRLTCSRTMSTTGKCKRKKPYGEGEACVSELRKLPLA